MITFLMNILIAITLLITCLMKFLFIKISSILIIVTSYNGSATALQQCYKDVTIRLDDRESADDDEGDGEKEEGHHKQADYR